MTCRVLACCCWLLAVVAAASSQAIEFSENSYSVLEGMSLTITVRINNTLNSDLNVTVTITPGASSTSDLTYNAADLTLMFPPNTTEQSFTIHAVSDAVVEGQETFTLELGMIEDGSGYMIMPGTMAQLVVEDTTVRVGANLTQNNVSEGSTVMVEVEVLSGIVTETFEVNVTSMNGTAGTTDYMPIQQTLTFSSTVMSHSLNISTKEDQEVEMLNEYFTISMSTTALFVKLEPSTITIHIIDTTVRVGTNFTQYTVSEGNTVMVEVGVLSGSVAEEFEVTVTSMNDTAGTTDYTPIQQTLTFSSTVMSHSLNIITRDDQEVEMLNEDFTISMLTTALFVKLEPSTITVHIIDTSIRPITSPNNASGILGAMANLSCVFESSNTLNISWFKDNVDITTDGRVMVQTQLSQTYMYTSMVQWNSSSFQDCGQYHCVAVSQETSRSVSSSTTVLQVIALNSSSPAVQNVSVGSVVTLFCQVDFCGPRPTIKWVVNDHDPFLIYPLPVDEVVQNDVIRNISYIVSTTTLETVGVNYKGVQQWCSVFDASGMWVFDQRFSFNVQNIEVEVTPATLEVVNGSGFNVTCNAKVPPDVENANFTFEWFRSNSTSHAGNALISEKFPYSVKSNKNVSVLTVIELRSYETNLFVCQVTIRGYNDTVRDESEVSVLYPPIIDFPRNILEIPAGVNRIITCSVRAQPKATFITISRDGTVVARTPENSTAVTTLSYLIVNPRLITSGSSEDFKCTAGNSLGNDSKIFFLEVEGVPEMVNISTLTSTLLSFLATRLVWIAPSNNNDPITIYTLRYCDNVGACNSATASKPATAVSIMPNRNYTINITATNLLGDSLVSGSGEFRGPIKGEADVRLSVDLITTDLAVLTWDFPRLATSTAAVNPMEVPSSILLEEVTILQSTVTYGFTNDLTEEVLLNRTDRVLLPGLVPDRLYRFSVDVSYQVGQINNIARNHLLQGMTLTENAPTVTPPPQPEPQSDGILIKWRKLNIDESFVDRYAVFVTLASGSGRRKREAMPVFNATSSDTQYLFENPDPFTEYLVNVDGVLDVNGETGTVTALPEQSVTSAEQKPSPPRELRDLQTTDFTSFSVDWLPPANRNGVIRFYTVLYTSSIHTDSEMVFTSSPSSNDRVSVSINDAIANTAYEVRVTATNGQPIPSEPSASVTITTTLGVFPPVIRTVVSNSNDKTYSIFINTLSSLYGPISHYFVYVVESRDVPDTSEIPKVDDNSAYITAVYSADTVKPITVGNGENTTYGRKSYINRGLKTGTQYYIFIRLYSSVNSDLFSDSAPMTGNTFPEEEKSPNVIAIVAGVLAAVAVILLVIFIVLIVLALCGNKVQKYRIPRSHRLGDGEGKGIELRRRTRLFSPVLNVGDPNAFTSAGQPTTLICEVSGTPAPTVTWTREEKPLEDERFLVLADHSLFIQDTCLEDGGEYVVKAENSAGVSEAQVKVTIVKPSPPEPDVNHTPVPVDNFPEYHARLSANDAEDLEDEYSEIEPDFPQTSYTARLQINRNKNRYINIIPYDHSRVVLPLQENTPGSDYINASYIDGYQKSNQYIASQGPTTSTISDFWRMIWELDCPTIVMVTKLQEEDKSKCAQYWPNYGSTTYGNVQVTLKEAENLAEYSIRTFSISPLAGQSSAQMPVREVKQFHFLKWPDHGVPNYATALLHFRKRVNTYHPAKRGPMVVHCSAGVGRTGTFITVDYVMQQMASEGVVDIYNFVQQMRYKRNYMVQTAPQYVFIHEAIDEAIRCGDTSIKAPQLKEWLSKLEKDADTGKDALESQFENLSVASPHDDEFDCTVAEINKDKNRTKDHLPSNDNRVVLSTDNDHSDYICASTVDGYRQRNAFMVTQGPMEATVGDFWRMVWEHKSAAIIMLTELEEDGEEMCVKYWPDEVGQPQVFGLFSVELSSEVRDLGDYCTRKLKLSLIDKADESRIVTQFHFMKWTRSTPPPSAKPMIDMIDELQRVQRKSGNQPITVHCSDGLGRTGAFCTLYYVLDRVKVEQIVDVFQAVKTLRIQRTGLVENLGQYEFLHRATVEFLDTFSDYQNFK